MSFNKSDKTETFAPDRQTSLTGGTPDGDQTTQVTLSGENADDSPGALPEAWRESATMAGFEGPTRWTAGPYKIEVQIDGEETYSVELAGEKNTHTVASGVHDEDRAQRIGAEFVDRISPDEVSFHKSDPAVPEAAAAAKDAAPDPETSGGLDQFTN